MRLPLVCDSRVVVRALWYFFIYHLPAQSLRVNRMFHVRKRRLRLCRCKSSEKKRRGRGLWDHPPVWLFGRCDTFSFTTCLLKLWEQREHSASKRRLRLRRCKSSETKRRGTSLWDRPCVTHAWSFMRCATFFFIYHLPVQTLSLYSHCRWWEASWRWRG